MHSLPSHRPTMTRIFIFLPTTASIPSGRTRNSPRQTGSRPSKSPSSMPKWRATKSRWGSLLFPQILLCSSLLRCQLLIRAYLSTLDFNPIGQCAWCWNEHYGVCRGNPGQSHGERRIFCCGRGKAWTKGFSEFLITLSRIYTDQLFFFWLLAVLLCLLQRDCKNFECSKDSGQELPAKGRTGSQYRSQNLWQHLSQHQFA